MKKVKLQMEGLKVETFEVVDDARTRRGTVRGNEDTVVENDTVVRSCQTEQYDCTVQGGYSCDYGSCIHTGCFFECETWEEVTRCA